MIPNESGSPAPGPGLVDDLDGLDALAAGLRDLRSWAGSPSYARIARAVGVVRVSRGVPSHEATPARVTVYDCFRDGRRRIDTDLVVDIAEALGAGPDDRTMWRLAASRAMRPTGRVAPQVASLPAKPEWFTGRAAELAQLTSAGAARVQVVHGLAGVGKTVLAVTAAHDLLDRHLADTAIRVVLRSDVGDPDPFDAMVSVLRTFDPQATVPTTPAAQRAAYLRLLGTRRTVLVLDDVATVADVELLLPTDRRSRVIITSRWMLDWPVGAETIELGGLDSTESGRLLARVAGPQVEIGDGTAEELRQMSGGLPLAVGLIGARVARQASWTAAEHIHAYRDQLKSLQLEDVVLGALTVTYDGLAEDEQRALRLLALHPTPELSRPAAAALTGFTASGCDAILGALERSHLIRRVGPDRWEMHSLVQVFGQRAAVLHELPAEREAARSRLLDFYCASCAAAIIVPNPTALADLYWLVRPPETWEPAAAVAWLQTERATLLVAAAWANRQGHPTASLRLSTMLTWHLWTRGDIGSALSLLRVAVSTAALADDWLAEATVERYVGMTYVRSSRPAQARAHLERAVSLLHGRGHASLPVALNALAVCSIMTGDYVDAVDGLEQVVALALESGDADLHCRAVANLGVVHTRRGDVDEAIAALEEAARIAAANDWPDRERVALSNLADVFANSADPNLARRAIPAAEAAIRLGESFGDEVSVLYSKSNLAIALHRNGDTEGGRTLTVAVKERAERLDLPELTTSVLNNLAEMHQREGDDEQALSLFRRAAAAARQIDAAFELERAERGLAALESAGPDTVVSTTRGSSEGPG